MEQVIESLIHAVRCGDLKGVQFLNAEGPFGMTALGEACRAGQIDLMSFLLDSGASIGDVLHLSCEYKSVDMVNVLLASGVPVDSVDKYGNTLLHIAVERQNVEIAETLLKHGASVNKVDWQCCQSPLYVACKMESLALVKLLITFGANINLKDTSSYTPLQTACAWNKSLDVILTLLRHRALIDEVDRFGDTALHTACDRGRLDMVQTLLQHGASVNVRNKRHLTPLHLAFECDFISELLDYGAGSEKCHLYKCPCNTTVIMCQYEHHCGGTDHFESFAKYFIKLEVAGVRYVAKHRWEPKDREGWGQRERDSFAASCLSEIEKMKTDKIEDTNCTYYSLLCRKKSAMQNEKIVSRLSLEALKEYPIYGGMIHASYLEIPDFLRRRNLVNECCSFFEVTRFSQLPLELVPLILEYLSDADLGRLIKIRKTSRVWFSHVDSTSPTLSDKLAGMSLRKCGIS